MVDEPSNSPAPPDEDFLLRVASDPASLAIFLDRLTRHVADLFKRVEGIDRRLAALEEWRTEQGQFNETVRDALVDKIEPRLKRVEERPERPGPDDIVPSDN
jgi:hypothetical protein